MKNNIPILGCDTISLKEVNQDYTLVNHLKSLGYSVMAVADGLGSSFESEKASKFICENLIQILENTNNEKLELEEIFKQIASNLAQKFQVETVEDYYANNCYRSTLIVVIETNDTYTIGYVGNGGILHIRGDFNTFPSRIYLPWNAINLLNPHSVAEEGKNAMYRYMSPDNIEEQYVPSILSIEKDQHASGDIIVICSDGIFSNDEVKIGKDASGNLWISGEKTLKKLYDHLNHFFLNENYDTQALKLQITSYLQELKDEQLLDDDATLAVSISPRAQEFQSALKEKGNFTNEENN